MQVFKMGDIYGDVIFIIVVVFGEFENDCIFFERDIKVGLFLFDLKFKGMGMLMLKVC